MASSTSLTLAPTAGQVCTTVQVSGSGFGDKETVAVTFDATRIATTQATKSGMLFTSFMVPQTSQPGNHTVTATGKSSGRSASATFHVVRPTTTFWSQFGSTAAGGRANSADSTINPRNVAQLTWDWSATLTGGGGIPGVAVSGDTVYAEDGAGIYALGAACGKLKWFSSTMGRGATVSSYISPAVANGMVYAGGGDNRIYAFDAQTGATRWTFNPQVEMLSSPTVANGMVYSTDRGGNVYALDGRSGAVRWSFHAVGDSIGQTPAVANGTVYFNTIGGIAYALDARTGTQRWQSAVGSSSEGVTVPAVDNGVLFVTASAAPTRGAVVALNATTGARKWIAYTPFYGTNGLAVANGMIYVSTISHGVSAFDEATGALKWQVSVAMGDSAPAVANGVVYVGAGTADLYAFDATTGAKLATFGDCGTEPDSSPVVANGVVYIGCGSILGALHLPGTNP
ncbi:MAG: PQQ-binding-like beta-propeller repeat protein [Nitrososphaerota archaeon]